MISIIAMGILAFSCVFVLPGYSFAPYRTPRNSLIVLAGYGLMGCWLASDMRLALDPVVLYLALITFGWWLLCSLLSPRRDVAMRNFVKFTMIACFGLFLVGGLDRELGLVLLSAAAVINSVYAVFQNKFKKEILKIRMTRSDHKPRGLIGNSNTLAYYLVPHVFFLLHLMKVQSVLWAPALGCVLYAMWLTQCRGAFIGLMAGLMVYGDSVSETPFMVIGIGGVVAYLIFKGNVKRRVMDVNSLKERYNYWRIGFEQAIRTPLFGSGFDVLKSRVNCLQRDINKRTNGAFLDRDNYSNPWPQKAHNDILQAIADNGFPGLFLISGIVYVALSGSHDPVLFSAMAAMLIGGLFFHTFHITCTNVLFWYLIGGLLDTGPVGAVNVADWLWVIFALFGYFVFKYSLCHTILDYCLDRYKRTFKYRYLDLALRCNKASTKANALAMTHFLNKGEIGAAYHHALFCIYFFDGDYRLWDMWTNAGTILLRSGSFLLAKACYETALTYLPWDEPAQKGLKEVERIENNLMRMAKKEAA